MLKIRLNEIPKEGRSYTFSRETGELNETLEDLINNHGYEIEFAIKPIGNAYDLKGTVKTTLTEVCSTCGYDFEFPVDRKFHEILVEEQAEDRKGHSVHGNQAVDFLGQGPSMTEYRGDVFEADEYLHEAIALSEPFYPTCAPDGQCSRMDEVREIRRRIESEALAMEEEKSQVGHPAFSILKDLDLDKKN